MKTILVADCSANICPGITREIRYVPLKIVTEQAEYVDDAALDVPAMVRALRATKGKTSTACPSVQDWVDAFEGADQVLGVSITGGLSGCYNASQIARELYCKEHPDAKVFILDSLSTGPEMELILEKYQEYLDEGLDFETICRRIQEYAATTHLIFSLQSLDNFAKNGRISPVVAKAVGVLGLRIIGKASDKGTLEPLHKCRGEVAALQRLLATMREMDYRGGKVRISHTCNEGAAKGFAALLRKHYPDCDISLCRNRGLCSYYAEEGGILVGFETRH